MLRTSVLVTGVVGAMICHAARASLVAGVSVSLDGGAVSSYSQPASGFGSFNASTTFPSPATPPSTPVAEASGTLGWLATSYSYSGKAVGAAATSTRAAISATSTGIGIYTFTQAMIVQVSWDLSNVAALAPATGSLGWTITDALGNFAYGITYFGGSPVPNVEGGVPQAASHSGFVGQLGPGTWTVSTSVMVDPPGSGAAPGGGAFSVSMIFTPAPGALPLVAIASIVARRGRRR